MSIDRLTSHQTAEQPAGVALRALLGRDEILVCPGITNPLFALVADSLGAESIYLTGAGIANMEFGVPDIGLVSMTEALSVASRVTEKVSIPVVADIDTGYGGPLQVMRTVREFEAAGVAAIQLEDQVNPKKCGHFDDKRVVSEGEMEERIFAAVEARRHPSMMIIARTDAREPEGFDAAIARSHLYVGAGADAIFIEAPASEAELSIIPKEFDVPTVANMVEDGKTPLLSPLELEDFGFKIVIFANTVSRVATAAARGALVHLIAKRGTQDLLGEMVTWEERQGFVKLEEYQALEADIAAKAGLRLKSSSER